MSWMDGLPDSVGNLVHRIPSPGEYVRVHEDKYGQLWAIYSNGIQIFKDNQWIKFETEPLTTIAWFETIVPHTPFLPAGPNEIIYLLKDKLCLFSVLSQNLSTIMTVDRTSLGQFIDLSPAKKGGFWVTGEKGIARLYINEETGQVSWREHICGLKYIRNFHALVEAGENSLYVVANDSRAERKLLVQFEFQYWKVLEGYTGSVEKGWPGKNGFWVFKDDATLAFVNGRGEEKVVREGILSGHIKDAAVDSNGIFYLATSHGIARYSSTLWNVPEGTEEFTEPIHAIHEDSLGRIWFGSDNYILKLEGNTWKKYTIPRNKILESFRSRSLSTLKDGRLVIDVAQMDPEILVFDTVKETFEFLPYRSSSADSSDNSRPRFVFEISPRRDGTVWVRTGENDVDRGQSRLEIFDGNTFTLVLEGGAIVGSRDIIETSNGDMFIGITTSERSLVKYHNGDYKFFDQSDGFKADGVFYLYELEDGTIWAASRKELHEFKDGKWSVLRSQLDNVYSISGSLGEGAWVASGTGVHRYVDSMWVTYTADDGLPNTAVLSVLRDSQGRVWAGTTKGLALFNPDADQDPPETFIDARNNLSQVPSHGEVRLLFSGVDKWHHTRSEHLLFAHRLDGGPWSAFQQGTLVDYKGLEYGAHRFEVRAMDLSLNVDAVPAVFDFTVLLPWYRERGFLTVATIGSSIILILLGVAIHRHFMLEKLVIERTSELSTANESLLQNQEKLEILLDNERLLARVASLLNSSDAFYELSGDLMKIVGSSTGLDLVCLVAAGETGKTADLVKYWFSPAFAQKHDDAKPAVEWLGTLPASQAGDGPCFISCLANLPPGQSELMREHGFESLAVTPLALSRRTAAVMFLAKMEPHDWSGQEKELFCTVADMIANSWQRQIHLQARLEAETKQSEAAQMAEKASRMASIGVMAGGITHEINQPLNALKLNSKQVLGWIERSRDLLPPKMVEKLCRVPEYIDRIDEIVKHMREFWISPDQNPDELFDIGDSVRHALTLINRQINTHNIQFNLNVEPEAMLAKGNRISVELIVINLTVNAVQALNELQKQERIINIHVGRKSAAAVVEVSDNGKALFQGEEEKIFDPFFSTKKPGQGIGLGLAIVKRMTEELRGTVRAHINSEGGATFIVEIPLHGQA